MVIARSDWNQKEKLLTTQISGDAAIEDVKTWEASLQKSLEEISDNDVFKIFINLDGFKAVNFKVHKAFREIIPRSLANYGWRVGYLDMFPEASVELKSERGIVCKAAVHVHHDETKITNYDKNYSRQNERFFTDVSKAKAWNGKAYCRQAAHDEKPCLNKRGTAKWLRFALSKSSAGR